jgi:hypothetical protein
MKTRVGFEFSVINSGSMQAIFYHLSVLQWNGQSLVNPTLILDLPAEPGPNHDGGKIAIGPDGYLYAVIGDLNHDGQLQNFPDGPPPDEY